MTVSPQSVHYSSKKVERLVSYFDEDESVMAYVAKAILDLAGKPVLQGKDSEFMKGVESIVGSIVRQESVARENRDVGSGRCSKITARNVMAEVERILSRSNSGMSLLERLQHDPVLRQDLFSLLREFDDLGTVDQLVSDVATSRNCSRPDTGFDAGETNIVAYRAKLPEWDAKQEE